MIPKIQSKELLSRCKKAIQDSIAKFEKDSLSQFEKYFNELDVSYQEVINKQKQEIEQLKQNISPLQMKSKMILEIIEEPQFINYNNQNEKQKMKQKFPKTNNTTSVERFTNQNPSREKKVLFNEVKSNNVQMRHQQPNILLISESDGNQFQAIKTDTISSEKANYTQSRQIQSVGDKRLVIQPQINAIENCKENNKEQKKQRKLTIQEKIARKINQASLNAQSKLKKQISKKRPHKGILSPILEINFYQKNQNSQSDS